MTTAEAAVFLTLALIPLLLTLTMFLSRNPMLGFPSGMMWAIFGARNYQLSTVTWDIHYLLFFASAFGMTMFTILAALALRKRDLTLTKEQTGENEKYMDETGRERNLDKQLYIDEVESGHAAPVSQRRQELHQRVERRRSGGIVRKIDYGEFK